MPTPPRKWWTIRRSSSRPRSELVCGVRNHVGRSLVLALVLEPGSDDDVLAGLEAALAQRQSRGLIDVHGGTEGQPSTANRVNCGEPKPADFSRWCGLLPGGTGESPLERVRGTAIRSRAWPGSGGQEGSETSGVSPNHNPRRRAPGLRHLLATRLLPVLVSWSEPGPSGPEDEIVQASRKREGS